MRAAADKETIFFHYEDTAFTLKDETKIVRWLRHIAKVYDVEIDTLNYIFCSDSYILQINKTYLNHDYYTDIITFPYRQGRILESDIYISIDTIHSNAKLLGLPSSEELLRVICHGVLHLIGYKDKTEEEEQEMRLQENRCISLFNSLV